GARLVDHLAAGGIDRGAPERCGARTAGALAEKHLIGVALKVLDVGRINAEAVPHDLLGHGLVALALVGGAAGQRSRARAVAAAVRALIARGVRAFDGGGDAEPTQLAALARLLAARRKAVGIGEVERHLEIPGKIPAVIGESKPGSERQRLRRNSIALAQL